MKRPKLPRSLQPSGELTRVDLRSPLRLGLALLSTWTAQAAVPTTSLTIAPFPGGAVQLTIHGAPGSTNAVQTSDNLTPANWKTLTNLVSASETISFVDAPPPSLLSRFYRGLLLQADPSAGLITAVAGRGQAGSYTGDGGPATEAGLSSPGGIALDTAGNLYVADEWNNVIQQLR